MEDLSIRASSIATKIFNFLDEKSLVQSRGINRNIKHFLNNERFFFLRIINNYKGNFVEFEESWKKILHKSPLGFVKELALITQQFFLRRSKRLEEQWHPLHIAAESGSLQICRKIVEKTGNRYVKLKVTYIRLADSTCLLVEVFLSDMIQVEVCGKI